jgi:hypothetical protein
MVRPSEVLLGILSKAEEKRAWRARLVLVAVSLGWALAYIAGVSCASMLLTDSLVLRYVLLAAFIPIVCLQTQRAMWRRIFKRNANEIAAAVEAADSELKGHIRPATDLAGHLPPGTSSTLTELAQERAVALLRQRDSSELIEAKAPIPLRPAVLGILTVVFLITASDGLPFAWTKKALPWLDPPVPLPFVIWVAPGDTVVSQGSAVDVRCEVAHMRDERPRLLTRRAGELDRMVPISLATSTAHVSRGTAEVSNAGSGFRYLVVAGEDSSSWFTVSTYAPLRLTDVRVTYRYPAYTGLEELSVQGNISEISAVKGTEASLSLSTNNTLSACYIRASSRTTPDTLVVAGTGATGLLSVEESEAVELSARDVWGQESVLGSISTDALPDTPPVIEAVIPGRDLLLTREMTVEVGVDASDDYGLSLLRIRYVAGFLEGDLVLAEGALGREGAWTKTWSLENLGLLPEDVVSYRFEVFDNDAVSGPKITSSDWFRLRFPSLTEIVTGIEDDEQSMIDSLETLSEDGQEVYKRLQEVAADLAGAETATWGEREDLKELAERQKELSSRLGELADQMAELERRSEESDLLPVELLERVAKVQHLLRELDMPELKQALNDLQDAIDELSPEEIERALSRLASQQEKILSSLDRTIEFLEQLHTVQQLSHLVREAERLTEEQEALMHSEDVRSPEESTASAEHQEKIAEDLKSIDEGVDQVAEEMEELMPSFSESLQAALSRLRDTGTEEALEEAAERLRAGSLDRASERQEQALAGLQQFTSDLQAAEGALMSDETEQILEAVESAHHTVLDFSREQEGLTERPFEPDDAHRRQLGITEAMRVLRERLEEVLAHGIGPASSELLGLMARAQVELDRAALRTTATQSLSQKERALEALNRVSGALSALREQLENASPSCSGSMGMEQLFGLSQAQSKLNASCRSLLPNAGELSQEILSSIGARQRMIREELSRLAERIQGEGQVMGDLGSVGQEMEDVIEQLSQAGLDDEVVKRQRKILSRLLDAQKSIRRQGVARRRRAVTATKQTAPVPEEPFARPDAELSPKSPPPPRNDDSYPVSYRALIDAYFRAVERK